MASLMPLPEPPGAGARVMFEYAVWRGVTSSWRNGYRRLDPSSLSVTGPAGFPTLRAAVVVVAPAVVVVLLLLVLAVGELEPHAASAMAAGSTRKIARFKVTSGWSGP